MMLHQLKRKLRSPYRKKILLMMNIVLEKSSLLMI